LSMGVPSRTSAPTPALDQTYSDSQIILGQERPSTSPGRGPSTSSDHCSITPTWLVSRPKRRSGAKILRRIPLVREPCARGARASEVCCCRRPVAVVLRLVRHRTLLHRINQHRSNSTLPGNHRHLLDDFLLCWRGHPRATNSMDLHRKR